jgi:cation diffusion facilitator family transporter
MIAFVINRPPNIKFPYGYNRADTIASKALSFVIFFAGAQLAISTVHRLMEGASQEMPEVAAIFVTLFSIAGKQFLAWYLLRTGRSVGSSMLIANARNMQSDVIISLSVLIGLFFVFILKMPVIDSITALVVSVWIMYTGYRIFMLSNLELMDGIEDPAIYNRIFGAIAKVEGVSDPHNVRVRKIGHQYMIAVDIEIDGSVPLKDAHDMAHQVDEQLRKDIENVYDVLVHMEPKGAENSDRRYGVSEKEIK